MQIRLKIPPYRFSICREGFTLLGCHNWPPQIIATIYWRKESRRSRIFYLNYLTWKTHNWRSLSNDHAWLSPRYPSFCVLVLQSILNRPQIVLMIYYKKLWRTYIVGGWLSDWAWLKASLPSSRGCNNIMRASLHVPASYIGFLNCHSLNLWLQRF